ncbi:alpha/beta hydrolase [Catelliglobosispora koreensis]|uniref:alpha/beta hydrolase n=1 Tax=Catelliglobosispora koreensis TaxID=129052 RepID=UPI002ADE0951|nr:alpha/beta hydrolase-fold protein [Catelliglobosispora koreensis]
MDVLIRLIRLADRARESNSLDRFLMDHGGHGTWSKDVGLSVDFRCSYQLCVLRDEPIRGVGISEERWMLVFAMTRRFGREFMGIRGVRLFWSFRRLGCSRGTRSVKGSNGHCHAGRARDVGFHVYEPAGEGTGYPLLLMFDGDVWNGIDGASTLDNLIAERAIPPVIAVMVESMYGAEREQSLTQPDIFLKFLLDDLLLFLSANYSVMNDPAKTVLAGQSLGGLAAAYAGLTAPHRIGRILTQSGSFWRARKSPEEVDAEEILAAFASNAKADLRFYHDAGLLEGNLLDKNRDLHKVLSAKGYDVTNREFPGGHDCAWWRGGLADGLIALL